MGRALSRADCTAGKSSATSTPMMAITTNSSTSVKPVDRSRRRDAMSPPIMDCIHKSTTPAESIQLERRQVVLALLHRHAQLRFCRVAVLPFELVVAAFSLPHHDDRVFAHRRAVLVGVHAHVK